jgi:hypothetical protein
MDILKDTALSTETLHLLQTFCTFDICSEPHWRRSTSLATMLHLQPTLRPATDTLHLKTTPCTSERSSNSNKHCAPLTYIRISDRNSSSLTDTVHLLLMSESRTGILHLLHSASLSHIKISDRYSASLTDTLYPSET